MKSTFVMLSGEGDVCMDHLRRNADERARSHAVPVLTNKEGHLAFEHVGQLRKLVMTMWTRPLRRSLARVELPFGHGNGALQKGATHLNGYKGAFRSRWDDLARPWRQDERLLRRKRLVRHSTLRPPQLSQLP